MKKISKQVTLGIDPFTGKRVRRRIYATSKTALAQAEKDVVREFAQTGVPSKITYKEYEQKWFEAYRSQTQPHTQAGYRSILKRNIPLQDRKLKDITKTDLQKIINDNWYTPSVCERYASMMKQLWDCAIDDGICQKNVAHGLRLPKKQKTDRRPLTEKELQGIRDADLDPMERFMMDVLLQFGLRPGEALALTPSDFSRKDRILTISKAVGYKNNIPFIKDTKTGVTRRLPVPDSFWNKIPDIRTLYFFTGKDGKMMHRSYAFRFQRRIIDKINAAMGGNERIRVTDMTFYNCRHHKASLLYYLPGISIKKKAEYMGHSERLFLQTYSHMMEDKEDTEILRTAVI